jgi:hypothetical protein
VSLKVFIMLIVPNVMAFVLILIILACIEFMTMIIVWMKWSAFWLRSYLFYYVNLS